MQFIGAVNKELPLPPSIIIIETLLSHFRFRKGAALFLTYEKVGTVKRRTCQLINRLSDMLLLIKSIDTWSKVLHLNPDTGAAQVCYA